MAESNHHTTAASPGSEETAQAISLAQLVAELRSITWLSPVSAAEMNTRDRWLADLIERAAQAPCPHVWQPIATAPKDVDVLLWGPFVPTGGTYMDIGRWINSGQFWDWSADDSQPTHWMPLPAPPAPAPEGDDG